MSYIDENMMVKSMSRDIAKAAAHLSDNEARFLVDYYYICQEDRIRNGAQIRALEQSNEPNMVLQWLFDQSALLEKQVKRALERYTDEHPIGSWIKSLYGFGPVLAAGFIAHIDITKAPAAGNIWSFAGLVPGVKWERGQKRPWNAKLKTLCFKAGDCMIKFSNREECYYGKIYADRKRYEWEKNLRGEYINYKTPDEELEDVEDVEAQQNKGKSEEQGRVYGRSTEAWAWVNGCYDPQSIRAFIQAGLPLTAENLKSVKGKPGSGMPMLPPAHIQARARRYAVKIFLSHLHEVWYEHHYQRRVPAPFVIEHMGHVHRIKVPNYDSPYAGSVPSVEFRQKNL